MPIQTSPHRESDRAIDDRAAEYDRAIDELFTAPSLVFVPAAAPPTGSEPSKVSEAGIGEIINAAIATAKDKTKIAAITIEPMGKKSYRLFPETRAQKKSNFMCAFTLKEAAPVLLSRFGYSAF